MNLMENNRFPGILALITFITIVPLTALHAENTPFQNLNSQDTENRDTGMSHFSQAVNKIWEGHNRIGDIAQLLGQAETSFQAVEDAAARNYLLARVELYRGRAVLMQSPKITNSMKTEARASLEHAMKLAEDSLNLYKSADTYRVLADAGATWMVTKGLFGIIKMAPNVQEWSDKALSINPGNALAEIISSQGKIHAPKSSGGDPQEAVRRLTALYTRSDLDKVERFRASSVLIQAHKKLKQKENAAYYCEQARSIFPGNMFIEELCK